MATHNNRIQAIQEYANARGFALALPRLYGSGTVGFHDCTDESQSYQLDRAADYLLTIAAPKKE